MAQFYADEDFPIGVSALLRAAGHDVLTTQQARRLRAWDADHLRFATDGGRTILTSNRKDFRTLHEAWLLWSRFWREPRSHAGILTFDQVGGQANPSVYVTAVSEIL